MATKPTVKNLTGTSVDILNAIRNSASVNYRDYVPVAANDAESVREIGAVIMEYPALQNEFLSNLINRIGRVVITSKLYQNPLASFKKGMLDFGESVEEIFADIAKPYTYDAEVASNEVFKREIPDVRAAFHVTNYQKFYKVTIQQEQLRQAFLSWSGVDGLIARITDTLYTAASYDEFTLTKYLLAKKALAGELYPAEVSAETTQEALKANTAAMRAMSNKLTFMSNKYNLAGVTTHTPRDEQYILVNADYEASQGVEVMAYAFNMSQVDYLGHRILVDGFGEFDTDRLNQIFTDPEDSSSYINNYTQLTSDQLTALNAIPAILVDKDFFMIYDVLQEFTEQYNGQGLYWNYWLHRWNIFSASPFANAVIFTPVTPAVTALTVSPATAEVAAGQTVQFTAAVTSAGFASQAVTWTIEGDGIGSSTISSSGLLKLGSDATGTITVTATSVFNTEITGTATVTVQV